MTYDDITPTLWDRCLERLARWLPLSVGPWHLSDHERLWHWWLINVIAVASFVEDYDQWRRWDAEKEATP